jgi:hypothetical protein
LHALFHEAGSLDLAQVSVNSGESWQTSSPTGTADVEFVFGSAGLTLWAFSVRSL